MFERAWACWGSKLARQISQPADGGQLTSHKAERLAVSSRFFNLARKGSIVRIMAAWHQHVSDLMYQMQVLQMRKTAMS